MLMKPVMMLVDDEPESLSALLDALARRFGGDYRVVSHLSARAALADLERIKADGEQVALVITSMPGVFAVGDVRLGSAKRVASAVGEGAVVVQYIHEYLTSPAALEGDGSFAAVGRGRDGTTPLD